MYSIFPSIARTVGLYLSQTLVCSALLLLASCKDGGYTYTFNDNVIYSPGTAGQKLANVMRDPGLQGCLNQFMEATRITDLAQVQLLACPGSNVETLAGIEQLTGLQQLELSDNKVTDLRQLVPLKNLRVIGLNNNRITTIAPLMDLQLLRFVSLQGDELLPCREVAVLKSRLGNTLTEPLHCKE